MYLVHAKPKNYYSSKFQPITEGICTGCCQNNRSKIHSTTMAQPQVCNLVIYIATTSHHVHQRRWNSTVFEKHTFRLDCSLSTRCPLHCISHPLLPSITPAMAESTASEIPVDFMQQIQGLFQGLGSQITGIDQRIQNMERRQERIEHWQSSHSSQLGSIHTELMALTTQSILTEGRSLENTNSINQIMDPTGTPIGSDSRREGNRSIMHYNWLEPVGLCQHVESTKNMFTNLGHRLDNLDLRVDEITPCQCDASLGDWVDKLAGKHSIFYSCYQLDNNMCSLADSLCTCHGERVPADPHPQPARYTLPHLKTSPV